MNPLIALLAVALPVARLLTPLPAPPVMNASEWNARPVPSGPARPAAGGSTRTQTGDSGTHLRRPNAAGVVDLAGALNAAQAQADEARPANPFRLRYHPPVSSHAVSVAIEAVMLGASPEQDCCVLNRQPLHCGETFEGLVVAQISQENIVLRKGADLLELPVGEQTFTLQLPTG